jgi:hypothetical protein
MSIVGVTTTAPRPTPVTAGSPSWAPSKDAERTTVAGAAELLDPPPPPQDAIPTKTADTIKPIKTLRTFVICISLHSVCHATGIADYFSA